MDKVVDIDYKAECKRLQDMIQNNNNVYNEIIEQKDKEILWHKKVIEKMLHI